MTWIVLIVAIIFNAVANILIKAGMEGSVSMGLAATVRHRFFSLPILGGIACFGLALAAYSYILSRMNLSVAYPIMTSAGFAIISIASVVLLPRNPNGNADHWHCTGECRHLFYRPVEDVYT